jgi:hypothetical protein
MAFRPHFLRVDAEARRLDEVYEGMTEGEKEAWEDWAAEHVGLARCAVDEGGVIVSKGKIREYALNDAYPDVDVWYDVDAPDGISLETWAAWYLQGTKWYAASEAYWHEGQLIVDLKYDDDTVVEGAIIVDINLNESSGMAYANVDECDAGFRWYTFSEAEKEKKLKAIRLRVEEEDGMDLYWLGSVLFMLIGDYDSESGELTEE